MYRREHHQHIDALLSGFNAKEFARYSAWFGGGTAIALALNEYRLSTDIDFLCSDPAAYKELRNIFRDETSRRALLGKNVVENRDFKVDSYAIRGVLSCGGLKPVKFEIVYEARIQLDPGIRLTPETKLLTLTPADLFAEKLLANEDCGLDEAFHSRDIIDIAFLTLAYGPIPESAWKKVDQAYGLNEGFYKRLDASKEKLRNPYWFKRCQYALGINDTDCAKILPTLGLQPDTDTEFLPLWPQDTN